MSIKKNGSDLLRDWIGDRTHDYVARLLRVQPSHLSHWLCGRRIPGLANAVAIEELTAGAVPVRAWLR